MVPGSSGPLKIVVVDDDPQIRDIVGRCLVLFGASVTLCANAFEGIGAIMTIRPDAVLVDLIMPGQDGFALLRQIRSLGPDHGGDVPVIVTTGLRDPDLESNMQEAGFSYLAKPFTPSDLFNSVIQAVDPLSPLDQRLAAFPIRACSPTS
jgi:CheY-like chemotaxis protein